MPGTEPVDEGSVVLTGDEVDLVRAALNEVVNALNADASFDERVAEELLKRSLHEMRASSDLSPPSLRLAAAERNMLHAALIRTLAEFEPSEMETRMGVGPAAVERLMAKVQT